MKKQILKILICTLILLIGIGAASAIEDNSTDETISFEEPDQMVSVSDVDDGDVEVLAAESDEAVELESASGEIQTAEAENDNAVSVNEKETEKLTYADSTSDDAQTKVEYKTFTIAKLKLAKKYKKYYGKDLSEMPKKVQKYIKKILKQLTKSTEKKMKKIYKNNWKDYEDLEPTVKKKGKYYIITYKAVFYRTV